MIRAIKNFIFDTAPFFIFLFAMILIGVAWFFIGQPGTRYFKEGGLCYAERRDGTTLSITNVPCGEIGAGVTIEKGRQ